MSSVAECVRREVEELHAFFVDWFAGRLPNTPEALEAGFGAHVTDDFELSPPDGAPIGRQALTASFVGAHGGNTAFEIKVHDVQVLTADVDTVVARYQEWQRGAKFSATGSNARWSVAVFVRDDASRHGLRWRFVQETTMADHLIELEHDAVWTSTP